MHTENSDQDRLQYVSAVLDAYRNNPDTLGHVRASDRKLARHFFDARVPLKVICAALALAALRRGYRADGADPHEPIRSLHYFKPIIEEVAKLPADSAYFTYLEIRMREYPAAQ